MANKLIQWNCRGLKVNFNELLLLLTGLCPSIICLQETFLKPSDSLNIRGYNMYNYIYQSVDLEKAYDTTWKYGIMRDLSDFGLKGRLPIFIDNFLSNRNFKVRVGTTLSGLQGQEEGVPQGSILSVTLFSIKINNIVKALNPGVDCSLYVDDFLICYRSKHIHTIELQQCLNKIQKWALENGFKFSKTKTQCMHFCQLGVFTMIRSLSWMVWRSLWLTSINF